jgi:hypothetical protein
MTKGRSSSGGSSKGSSRSSSSSGKGSASYGRGVSSSRLSQKSGTTYGGYTKVAKPNGTFRMEKNK